MSERHKHLLDKWISHLDKLTYPDFDVLLVDTTPDTKRYYKFLKKKKVQGKKIELIRRGWDYKKYHVLQLLAYAIEDIRQYFLANDYDFLFFLDDDIFIPKNSIQKLLSRNKDIVGFIVHILDKAHRKPCVFKTGELIFSGNHTNFFTFTEINEYKKFVKKFKEGTLNRQERLLKDFIIKDKWKPDLMKVYGMGTGCLMIKKKVLKEVPFRTHETFILGEDIWFFQECNDKHFEYWLDTTVRAKHKNTNWNIINQKGQRGMPKVFIAMGKPDATEAVMVK